MWSLLHRIARRRVPSLVAVCLAGGLLSGGCSFPATPSQPPAPTPSEVEYYSYEVIQVYPHDAKAFTQGLAFDDGVLYEGTGLRGTSSLRRVQLETGAVLQSIPLSADCFGEGIAVCGDRIIQLTWKSRAGFVYDKHDMRLLDQFAYDYEGWGITCDGEHLIMSDGSARLYFRNPETYLVEYYVTVRDRGADVSRLNELEFVNGLIYANVWQTDSIAIIDPADGRVTGWLDLSGLMETRPVSGQVDVLNGIAWDAAGERLFVTGKLWPWLFEIRLVQD
jgi:glutaminyl-peptide cyclotransferase